MDFYIIAYDIPNNKRRRKLANLLEDYGVRVQKSVFEVWLDESDRKALMKRLQRLIKINEDSLRMYRLCELCLRKVELQGLGAIPQAPQTLII